MRGVLLEADRRAVRGRLTELGSAVKALRTSSAEDRPETDGDRAQHKAVRDLVEGVEDLDQATTLLAMYLDARESDVVGLLRGVHEAGHLLRRLLLPGGRLNLCRMVVRRWGDQWRGWSGVVDEGFADVEHALMQTETVLVESLASVLGQREEVR